MITKRISAELQGDYAILAQVIYMTTRLSSEQKKDADRMFCEISILAMEKIIDMVKSETGVQFPSHTEILAFLKKEDHDSPNSENATSLEVTNHERL